MIAPRKLTDPIVFSNTLFAINACVWLYVGRVYCAVAMLVSFVASMAYHHYRETLRVTLYADRLSAIVALSTTLYFAYPHLNIFKVTYVSIFLYVSLYIKNMGTVDYNTRHLAWHICVFMGQLFLASTIPLN